MRANRFSPARRAGSRRARPRAELLLAATLLVVSGAAAQTPAPGALVTGRPTAALMASRDAGEAKTLVEAKDPDRRSGADQTKDASPTGNASPTGDAGQAKDAPGKSPAPSAQASLSPTAAPPVADPAEESKPPLALPPVAPRPVALPAAAPPAIKDALRTAPHGTGSAHYRAIIDKETARTGLPADIAEAVMAVESGFNPAVVGAAGEIGLMQLMPPTARMLGFSGSLTDLAQPEVNIHYGVHYLSQAWRLAGGDLCTAVMKYRAGHGETRFSQLSVNYCLAVRSKLAARGYPVSGSVPIATFGELTRSFTARAPVGGGPFAGPPRVSLKAPPPCRSHCLELGGGRPNFDEINSSLNHLVLQSNVRAIRLH